MSAVTPAPSRRLENLATLASSLLIPLPLLVSALVTAATFTSNPAGVDITNDLAYLREILGFGFGSLGVLLGVIVVLFVLTYRRARTLDALKLPLLVLGVQVVVGVAILLLTGISDAASDSYVS